MVENIEVETIFKNQVHERQKFKINIQDEEYHGILHQGEVQWFNPQPRNNNISDEQVDHIESSIQGLLTNQIEN